MVIALYIYDHGQTHICTITCTRHVNEPSFGSVQKSVQKPCSCVMIGFTHTCQTYDMFMSMTCYMVTIQTMLLCVMIGRELCQNNDMTW